MSKRIVHEFVTNEHSDYQFKIGELIASGLSGFIAGFAAASMIWFVVLNLVR